MTPEKFIIGALKTESCDYERAKLKLGNVRAVRLLHALLGINTENGELQDNLKKALFYGKDLDFNNLKEELGDLLWYIALACDALSNKNTGEIVTFEILMQMNHDKLKARYGDRFTDEGGFR
jgi:NTP pyrophosphatase (non-canonical NTP hydrolase)